MKPTDNKQKNVYVALLRGLNVGGHSVIKMNDVRELFEALGFIKVTSYIQTGNIIFSSNETNIEKIAHQIEKKFESSKGLETKVFILTQNKLQDAAAHNPFDPVRGEKEQRCHLMFLSCKPDMTHSKALMKLKGEEYQFHISGQVLYYAYSRKYDGKRRTIDFEKVLGVTGTSRSWKVMDKLIELSAK